MLVVLFLICLPFILFFSMLAWNFNELPSCTKKLLVKLETRLILKFL